MLWPVMQPIQIFIRLMVNEAVHRFGRLTMAVANAGITLFGDFFDYNPESLEKVMRVNLHGSFFFGTGGRATQMKKQKEGGSILLMSSVTAHQAHKDLCSLWHDESGD